MKVTGKTSVSSYLQLKTIKDSLITIFIAVILLLWVQCAHQTYTLHNLAQEGNVEKIRTCLSDPVCRKPLDMLDNNGRSALHTATLNGDLSVIHELLSSGADPNVRDTRGAPPLLYAAKTNNEKVFSGLLKGGADINTKIKDGRSILMDLILYGSINNVNLLLKHGADLTVKDSIGRDALIFACMKGDALILKKLIDMHPESTSVTNEKDTPIHYSAYRGSNECLSILLDYGYDINATNENDENALSDACSQKHINTIRFLLDHGINFNQKNKDQQYAYEKIFEEKKAASVSNKQNEILITFFEHGVVLPDSACDLSVQARVNYIAGNYSYSEGKVTEALKHHAVSKKAYLKEAELAIHTADSLQKLYNRNEAKTLARNILITAVSGALTGASAYAGLLAARVSNSLSYTFTYYTLIPAGYSEFDLKRLIDLIRDYASECKMMASRCTKD